MWAKKKKRKQTIKAKKEEEVKSIFLITSIFTFLVYQQIDNKKNLKIKFDGNKN